MDEKEWFLKARHINYQANVFLVQLRGYQERQWDDTTACGALPAWSRASPAMRAGSLFFLLLEVFKLGWQLKEGIENAFPEPTLSKRQRAILEEKIKLKQVMKDAEAIGGILVPVLTWLNSENGMWPQDKVDTPTLNERIMQRFCSRLIQQYEIIKTSDYTARADCMQKTHLSAMAAGNAFKTAYRPTIHNPWNTADPIPYKMFNDLIEAIQEALYALATDAAKEASSLRQLAVQPDPDAEAQALYRQKGFRWRNIPR